MCDVARLKARPMDILLRNAIVELRFGLVCEVPQAIPLAGYLAVEGPDIVVYDAGCFVEHFGVEEGAVEEGLFGGCLRREWPVEGDSVMSISLFSHNT